MLSLLKWQENVIGFTTYIYMLMHFLFISTKIIILQKMTRKLQYKQRQRVRMRRALYQNSHEWFLDAFYLPLAHTHATLHKNELNLPLKGYIYGWKKWVKCFFHFIQVLFWLKIEHQPIIKYDREQLIASSCVFLYHQASRI